MADAHIHFIDAPIFKYTLATRGEDGFMYRKDLQAGDANWQDYEEQNAIILMFSCPCGCGSLHMIHVYTTDTDNTPKGYGNGWKWNGDREKPTLSLSLQINSACRWHGYLTNGVFKKC
jgi:hypothetical protein